MKLNEKKSVVTGISLVTILGIVATCIGLFADVRDLFGSDEKISQPSVAEVQESNQIENSEENNNQAEISEENNNQIENSEESNSIEISEEEIIIPAPTSSKKRLVDLKVADSKFYESKLSEPIEDTVGNIYSGNVAYLGSNNYSDFATYYLGGKYKTLTGTIAVCDYSVTGNTTILNISIDENLIYTTGEIDRAFAPTEFSIDVEGVQWLRIDNSSPSMYVILSNWIFE